MKYNIRNLDEFKPKFGTIGYAPNAEPSINEQIAESTQDLIEDKIKELIEPYANTTINPIDELYERGYLLQIFENSDLEEYRLFHKPTGKYDFFSVKKHIDIKQEENQYTAKTYIGDIVRNIK